MQNNIILITDNEKVAQKTAKKILLLRKTDSFTVINHADCFDTVKKAKPVLVFYHLKLNREDDFLNFLQKIKQNKTLKSCSVILIYELIDENTLCSAFEYGMTDFIKTNSTETEFTIRTLWCLQKRENNKDFLEKKEILSQLKILDNQNNIFTENYTYTILKEESKKNWGCFVAIAADINVRSKISPDNLINIIKKNIRKNDILGYAQDSKIYLFFKKTNAITTSKILNKINKQLTKDYSISAGFIETKNISFEKAEILANKALSQALLKGNSFINASEQNKKIDTNNIKNFKIHKDFLQKKIENILSPLFYQIQKRNEEKLFETKIRQNVSDKEISFFNLENEEIKSSFNLTFSGFSTINILTTHFFKKEKEEKKQKIYLDIDDFSEEKIEELLNEFINNFKVYSNR